MKYIVMQRKYAGMIKEVPIIFPNELVHKHVAMALLSLNGNPYNFINKVASAGDVAIEADYSEIHCTGRSDTLNIDSRGDIDENLIIMCEYGVGLKEEE